MHITIEKAGKPVEEVIEIEFPVFFFMDYYSDAGTNSSKTWERIDADSSRVQIVRRSSGTADCYEWTLERDRVHLSSYLGQVLKNTYDLERVDSQVFAAAVTEMSLSVAQIPGAPPALPDDNDGEAD